jgi:endonuclease/exonuclease/phosphatase family metal-dependent hydrolase
MWLSETPEKKYTKSFDSKHNRIATWAVLENKETGEKFTHINTHLDHVLESTRVEQSKVLLNKIAELEKSTKVICTGDFNTKQGADAYNKMCETMTDSKSVAAQSDDGATYINYGRNTLETKPIDFIFVSEGVSVDTYKIIDEKIDRMYLSDHAGLCADVVF